MKNVNKILLAVTCFFAAGCEIYVPPAPTGTVAIAYEPAHVSSYAYDTSYCGYDPYEVTPYYNSPWACYDSYGSEFCEWFFTGYYSECIETWYYDWDWCEWVLYDEECYAI